MIASPKPCERIVGLHRRTDLRTHRRTEPEHRHPCDNLRPECSNVCHTRSRQLLPGSSVIGAATFVEIAFDLGDLVDGDAHEFGDKVIGLGIKPPATTTPDRTPPPAAGVAEFARCSRWPRRCASFDHERSSPVLASCEAVGRCRHRYSPPPMSGGRVRAARRGSVSLCCTQKMTTVPSMPGRGLTPRTVLQGRHAHATQRRTRQWLARESVGAGSECLPSR